MSGFFALLSRMRHISRWGLMRSSIPENVQEHSWEVAVLAHALAVIRRDVLRLGGADPDAAASLGLFHDATEILTGDLPTPIQYASPGITDAYRELERLSAERLLGYLPEELRAAYSSLLTPEGERGEARSVVRAADKLSAYIKCIAERKNGNYEFLQAERQTLEALRRMSMPELDYFLENFIPAFELSLDELGCDI